MAFYYRKNYGRQDTSNELGDVSRLSQSGGSEDLQEGQPQDNGDSNRSERRGRENRVQSSLPARRVKKMGPSTDDTEELEVPVEKVLASTFEFSVNFECWEDPTKDYPLDRPTFLCAVRDTIENLMNAVVSNEHRRVTLREVKLTKYEEI